MQLFSLPTILRIFYNIEIVCTLATYSIGASYGLSKINNFLPHQYFLLSVILVFADSSQFFFRKFQSIFLEFYFDFLDADFNDEDIYPDQKRMLKGVGNYTYSYLSLYFTMNLFPTFFNSVIFCHLIFAF